MCVHGENNLLSFWHLFHSFRASRVALQFQLFFHNYKESFCTVKFHLEDFQKKIFLLTFKNQILKWFLIPTRFR